ncbi:hypothetical protein L1887_52862 [Cichorium endivia]|nr:hypothetical protein L1887_52862 [Cichorium endivia]
MEALSADAVAPGASFSVGGCSTTRNFEPEMVEAKPARACEGMSWLRAHKCRTATAVESSTHALSNAARSSYATAIELLCVCRIWGVSKKRKRRAAFEPGSESPCKRRRVGAQAELRVATGKGATFVRTPTSPPLNPTRLHHSERAAAESESLDLLWSPGRLRISSIAASKERSHEEASASTYLALGLLHF